MLWKFGRKIKKNLCITMFLFRITKFLLLNITETAWCCTSTAKRLANAQSTLSTAASTWVGRSSSRRSRNRVGPCPSTCSGWSCRVIPRASRERLVMSFRYWLFVALSELKDERQQNLNFYAHIHVLHVAKLKWRLWSFKLLNTFDKYIRVFDFNVSFCVS